MVNAWAGANHVSSGKVAVQENSNATTATSRVLEVLDLSGALVTIDAMGCPREIAPGDGEYILDVQDIQPNLYQDIDVAFTEAFENDFKGLVYRMARTEDTNRARDESRERHEIVHPTGLSNTELWKGLTAISMMMCRQVENGVEEVEFLYDIGVSRGWRPITGCDPGHGASLTRSMGFWMWCFEKTTVTILPGTVVRTWPSRENWRSRC